MFTILTRLRPLVVDFITPNQRLAKFHYPRPSRFYTHNNYSRNNDFVIPLWSDMAINLCCISGADQGIGWKFADTESTAEIHPYIQYFNFITEKKLQQLKIPVPWVVKEKTGIKFLASSPTWALGKLQKYITPLPGILDFKYQHSANIQYLLNYPQVETTDSIVVTAGTPLYQFFPLSDRRVKIKTHIVSRDEYTSYLIPEKFSKHYYFRKTLVDKCPFH